MPRKPDTYHRPEDLTEALRLLAQPELVPLGGGTKLLAGKVDRSFTGVVDLQALGLNQIAWVGKQLQVGATARLAEWAEFLAESDKSAAPPESPYATPLLQQAIHQAGPNTYRNAATVGGVIASRLPDSELLAALLVLEATLSLYAPEPVTLNLAEYLDAEERANGLITAITIPWHKGRGNSYRVARTPADTPIVSVTVWQPVGAGPRLAATGIAERPCRLWAAEKRLADGYTADAMIAAADAARSASRHPGDFRGDASYRAEMAAVLTRRVCEWAHSQPAF